MIRPIHLNTDMAVNHPVHRKVMDPERPLQIMAGHRLAQIIE